MAGARKKRRAVSTPPARGERSVGELSIFGITDFWRVPTILPKGYMDLRRALTSFEGLTVGQLVCVGGRPEGLVQLSDGATLSGADEEGGVESCAKPPGADTDSEDEYLVGGRWTFELVDLRQRRLRIEVDGQTKKEQAWLDLVREGRPLWLHGLVWDTAGELTLRGVQLVTPAQLGEVLAFYPSRTRRTAAGKTNGRTKGKRKIRRMTSEEVGMQVRAKNRLAISQCASRLRERMRLEEPLDEWALLEHVGSPIASLEGLFKLAHSPPDVEAGQRAGRALERLAAIEMLMQVAFERNGAREPAAAVRISHRHVAEAMASLQRHGNITLTEEQLLAVTEIITDLKAPYRTTRALSGETSSGKSCVIGVVGAAVCATGRLVVVLEPRAYLAEQMHRNIAKWFPDVPVKLVTGATVEEIDVTQGILVGTTAVWSRLAERGCRPGFIVADEQQKFGVRARRPDAYAESHLLEATATPIPRTQGLIEYGGLEVSILQNRHVKSDVETKVVVGQAELEKVYQRVARRIEKKGLNLMLIYPRISAGEAEDADNEEAPPLAVEEAIERWERLLPGQVGVVHGRIPSETQSEVMARFARGENKVLIGTIILEVGIDFEKADMMIIHHPERMGVAAVHQLRGRLARRGGKGWCYLACSPEVREDQMQLLRLMETENNGFKLALADMARRGVGDMRRHARQQSGNYEGFLVKRTPLVEDIEWALAHCQRWIGEEEEVDLLADPVAELKEMAKLAGRVRKPRTVKAKDSGAGEEEQLDLF